MLKKSKNSKISLLGDPLPRASPVEAGELLTSFTNSAVNFPSLSLPSHHAAMRQYFFPSFFFLTRFLIAGGFAMRGEGEREYTGARSLERHLAPCRAVVIFLPFLLSHHYIFPFLLSHNASCSEDVIFLLSFPRIMQMQRTHCRGRKNSRDGKKGDEK
jgi:hypothetical protein